MSNQATGEDAIKNDAEQIKTDILYIAPPIPLFVQWEFV